MNSDGRKGAKAQSSTSDLKSWRRSLRPLRLCVVRGNELLHGRLGTVCRILSWRVSRWDLLLDYFELVGPEGPRGWFGQLHFVREDAEEAARRAIAAAVETR